MYRELTKRREQIVSITPSWTGEAITEVSSTWTGWFKHQSENYLITLVLMLLWQSWTISRPSSRSKIADVSCMLVLVHESDAASATKANTGYEGGDARMMSANQDFDAGGGGAGDGACRK